VYYFREVKWRWTSI